jgi:F-box domain
MVMEHHIHAPASGDMEMEMESLSDLPEHLLLHILSFLPTRVAARTSLLSRSFRRLWEASPVLDLDFFSFYFMCKTTSHFVDVANRTLLHRNPPSPLRRLLLYLPNFIGDGMNDYPMNDNLLTEPYIASLIHKASSLGLRHLSLHLYRNMWQSILPLVLSLHSLESLSLDYISFQQLPPCTPINLKYLKSLDINFLSGSPSDFLNKLVPQLGALEDLHIISSCREDVVLYLRSMTVKILKLILDISNLRIYAPSLELLHLSGTGFPLIQLDWEMPMLRKAFIQFNFVHEEDVDDISKMLSTIAHVQELHLNIIEHGVLFSILHFKWACMFYSFVCFM